MTDQATRVVPAGWYQDPALAEQVRWWNGLAWTEHVREKPAVTAAPDVAAVSSVAAASTVAATETSEQRIAAGRELERQFGIGTSENEIISGATALGYGTGAGTGAAGASAGAGTAAGTAVDTAVVTTTHNVTPVNPAVQRAEAERRTAGPSRRHAAPSRSATGSAWLIALTPVLTLLLGAVASYIYFYVTPTLIVFAIAIALPYLLGILWALGDRRVLTVRGFDAPSPAWALLGGIGYLIVRRSRVPGSGPLAMFLIVATLIIALPVAALGTGQLRPLQIALTIQSTINEDYVHSGRAASVSCPPFVDATTPGTLYTCTATLASGVTKNVWVSIDGPNGTFSFAMAV